MIEKEILDTDLIEDIFDYDVILVGTNCYGTMGNGFQKQISINFPYADKVNSSTPYADKRKLGTVVEAFEENKPKFCICFITYGYGTTRGQKNYLDYNALEKCMTEVNSRYPGKRIAMVKMGCSKFDGGGDWEKVKSIIEKTTPNCHIIVYANEQEDYFLHYRKIFKNFVQLYKSKKITYEDYYEYLRTYCWEEVHGIYSQMPDNYAPTKKGQYFMTKKEQFMKRHEKYILKHDNKNNTKPGSSSSDRGDLF